MNIVPYIYKITCIPKDKVYIGARFNSRGCHPSEFWSENKGYFTSSRHVKNLIKLYGTGLDVWKIEILEVFDDTTKLKMIPQIENNYILEFVENYGVSKIINRRWSKDGKEVYTNAGMKYKCQGISDSSKGLVSAKTVDGTIVRISKEEYDMRDDLVGIGAGTKYYHNPETNHRIKICDGELPPDGYIPGLGKTHSKGYNLKVSERRKNSVGITNGITNKYITKGEEIPAGWWLGQLPREMPGWTEERRKKHAETIQKKREERKRLKSLEPKKQRKSPRKRTPEEIEYNRIRQREAHEQRLVMGIPHKNKGRKRSQDSINQQIETLKKNKQKENFK